MTESVSSIISGEARRGPNEFEDRNPSRPDEVLAVVHGAGDDEVDAAVESARDAAVEWRRTPAPVRADALHRVADLLTSRADDIGRVMALEEGKTLAEAVGEVRSAQQFRYAAGRALEPDGSTVGARDPSVTMLWSRREPLGTVACITPWNFPASIPAWKLAHALASGNTVVWKPAELTPLTSARLATCLADAGLPPGVVNTIMGEGASVGRRLVQHPGIDGVSFTGSTAVGTEIARTVDHVTTRLQLEMGGSNAAVVMADADLDLAVRELGQGAFSSSGQKCTATARVIVAREVHDELVDRLTAEAARWRVGDALDPDTMYGPLASAAQYRNVADRLSQVDTKAFAHGGHLADLSDTGYFVEPTVIVDVPVDHPVVTDEIFGPVTTVVAVDDIADALSLLNVSDYGLSATIFSRDLASALRFVDEADVGVAKVNKATTGNEIHVPFGGRKHSGSGPPEMGWATWDFYTQWKTVYVSDVRGDS